VHQPFERRIVEALVVVYDFFLAVRAGIQMNHVVLRALAYPTFVATHSANE
jgi:hypothetical protein